MKITPATQLSSRSRPEPARGEMALRYAAAYLCTLISIAAAQLIIPNELAFALGGVTLLGLPISLALRRSRLHIGPVRIPRLLINSIVIILTSVACFYFILSAVPELFTRGAYQAVMVSTRSAGDSIAVLMNLFLIFAAFRSLAILNDKDAALSVVPSFSILLLLIVVHRGPAVVAYFLAWAIVTAILFLLDHREELHRDLSGVVPSLVPHQDVKLSARGLATVMGFSLACAIGISYYLSNRNPEERGVVESWILGMAGRMTQLALNMPDVSVNSGPERQIDYSSGPALPTRAELWTVSAYTDPDHFIRPQYWRMFTLSQYNGATWSQLSGSGFGVRKQYLTPREMPILRFIGGGSGGGGNFGSNSSPRSNQGFDGQRNRRRGQFGRPRGTGFNNPGAPSSSNQDRSLREAFGRQAQTRNENQNSPFTFSTGSNSRQNQQQTQASRQDSGSAQNQGQRAGRGFGDNQNQRFSRMRPGYDIAGKHPFSQRIRNSFGWPRFHVYQMLESRTPNVGFLPSLPAARAVRLRQIQYANLPDVIRTRQDGAVDLGVLVSGQNLTVFSEVPPDPAYGLSALKYSPPLIKPKKPLNPAAVITKTEKKSNLQLPAYLRRKDARIKKFVKDALARSKPNETNLRRAQRLAWAIQKGSVYTLRPPQIPEGVDAAEYFLFESRRGYCTYYAGALTVACRAAGIPARVVSGFVNPSWETRGPRGVLREANAHAWTEVWVDGWGWAVIDATPAQQRGDNAPDWWENWTDLLGACTDIAKRWLATHKPHIIGLSLLLMAVGLTLIVHKGIADPALANLHSYTQGRVKLSDDQSRRLIFRAYQRASKKLARRFRRRTHWETPHEYLNAAEAALELADAAALRDLTQLYTRAKYSPHDISHREGLAAYIALRKIDWSQRKAI